MKTKESFISTNQEIETRTFSTEKIYQVRNKTGTCILHRVRNEKLPSSSFDNFFFSYEEAKKRLDHWKGGELDDLEIFTLHELFELGLEDPRKFQNQTVSKNT